MLKESPRTTAVHQAYKHPGQVKAGGKRDPGERGKKKIDRLSDRCKLENCLEICIKRHFVEQSQKLSEDRQMFKGN